MITVILPAYNEAKNIGRVIGGLFEHGFVEIVVVDDGSTDTTAEVAEKAGATVIRHPINRGQGAALQTGDVYALSQGAETVAHFDADRQFNPKDIDGAVELLRTKQLDVVLGSRFLDSRSKIPWFKRRVILPVGRLINMLLTGVTLTDAHNGFRVLSRRALEKITINQDRMAHNTEIVSLIKKHGLRYTEYPVEVVYHEFGQNVGGGMRILWDVVKSKVISLKS